MVPVGRGQSGKCLSCYASLQLLSLTLSGTQRADLHGCVTLAGRPGAWVLFLEGDSIMVQPRLPTIVCVPWETPVPFLSLHLLFQNNGQHRPPSFSLLRAPPTPTDTPETPRVSATSISRQPNTSEARWAPGISWPVDMGCHNILETEKLP